MDTTHMNAFIANQHAAGLGQKHKIPGADILMDLPGNKVRTANISVGIQLEKERREHGGENQHGEKLNTDNPVGISYRSQHNSGASPGVHRYGKIYNHRFSQICDQQHFDHRTRAGGGGSPESGTQR